jgi:thioredoxin reductase (NADPH)
MSKRATGIAQAGAEYVIELAGETTVRARTVIIASGVTWRRLGVPSLEALQGAGVFYGAASSDAVATEGADVFEVGAGNSAGQAAVHLARSAAAVTLVVRGERLGASMSDYLVHQLEETPNIGIRLRTEVIDGTGTGRLTALTLRDNARGVTDEVRADALYVMIGAHPHTEWLAGTLARDDQGYILTGADVGSNPTYAPIDAPASSTAEAKRARLVEPICIPSPLWMVVGAPILRRRGPRLRPPVAILR